MPFDLSAEAITPTECIARGLMPQVDEPDIPALLDFLIKRGVDHVAMYVEARQLVAHQRIVPSKVRGILRANASLLDKPVLVSSDMAIVDGNHRVAVARVRKLAIPAVILARPFKEAVEIIFEFPRTYAYGDGAFHPVRN